MSAFDDFARTQWYRGTGDDAPVPSMIIIAKSFEGEARKGFLAGLEAAAQACRAVHADASKMHEALKPHVSHYELGRMSAADMCHSHIQAMKESA